MYVCECVCVCVCVYVHDFWKTHISWKMTVLYSLYDIIISPELPKTTIYPNFFSFLYASWWCLSMSKVIEFDKCLNNFVNKNNWWIMAKKIKFDPKFGLRGRVWVRHNSQNNMVTYIFFFIFAFIISCSC